MTEPNVTTPTQPAKKADPGPLMVAVPTHVLMSLCGDLESGGDERPCLLQSALRSMQAELQVLLEWAENPRSDLSAGPGTPLRDSLYSLWARAGAALEADTYHQRALAAREASK